MNKFLSEAMPVMYKEDSRLGLLSASFMPIAANCSGAKNLIDAIIASGRMPKETADSVRDQGIDIHGAMETGDVSALGEGEKAIAMRLKEIERVSVSEWRNEFNITEEPQVIREQRLWIRDQNTFQLLASAKVDFMAVSGSYALIEDFKTGFLDPTPSEVNWQCKTQAVSAFHEFPHITHVRAGIAASRLRDKLDLSDYDLKGLKAAEWEVMRVIEKTKAPDAPLNPGSHCRYCGGKSFCRAFAAWNSMEVTPFAGMDQVAIVNAVSALSTRSVGDIFRKKKSIEILLDAIKVRMSSMTPEELSEIGFEKKPGNEVRKVVDKDKIIAELKKHTTEDKIMSAMKIGVGDLDALVAETFNIPIKAVGDKSIELFGDAIEKKRNADSIKETK